MKSSKVSIQVVAVQQQDFYTQLINNFGAHPREQVVGDLWTSGGVLATVSHGGFSGPPYVASARIEAAILPKFIISTSKS